MLQDKTPMLEVQAWRTDVGQVHVRAGVSEELPGCCRVCLYQQHTPRQLHIIWTATDMIDRLVGIKL